MVRTLLVLMLVVSTAAAQESPHGKTKFECSTCHATDSWQMKKDAAFDHASTGFALTGQHKTVRCAACHKEMKFEKMNENCTSCHSDIHKSELGPNCQRCHTTQSWQVTDMIQKHQQTRFPLLGRHSTLNCQSCHDRASEHHYVGTPIECVACHRETFEATTSPSHPAAGFSTDCEQCHRVTSLAWGGGFDHNLTSFPLTGAHTAVSCITCHQNQVFRGIAAQCVACHREDYTRTTDPNHVAANFSTECQLCHSTASWDDGRFDHSVTRFPLTGAHQQRPCQDCHGDNVFAGKPVDCVACHLAQYTSAQNPVHTGSGFSQQCQTCHTTAGWRPASFDHNATRFPLTGEHAHRECRDCHVNNNYQLVYTDCFQCHQSNFQQATNPNHVAGNFNHDCTQCHTTSGWSPSTFDHSATNFPLTGAHAGTSCQSCHTNGNYQLVYTDCYQCHASNFQQVTNPNHVAGNFSHDCTPCHSMVAWTPATFNHAGTNFPLTGAHVTTSCQSCHVNGNYQLVYTDCYQCHASNFQQVTNPNHVTGNFSHDCTPCHSTIAWTPATFSHAGTNFPLTGAHVATPCQSCHVNGNYQLVYTDCYQCHASNFQQATEPNHVAGNFSHDCTPCHTTSVWRPSTFNHGNTRFPLTGAHQTTPCSQCHVNNQYQNLPLLCYDCHVNDFNGTTNPNHVAGNFNHDCTQCHTTTGWSPATFNHANTAFPLTGAHVATPCQSCHINGNYQLVYTDCYPCHQTDFQQPTEPNHVAGNFAHDCTPCHTTSVWRPSTFNHGNTRFPLTGAHQATPCSQCHINNQYQNLPLLCYDCHVNDFNGTTNPNHVAGNFSHDCTQCHTTTGWSPATFNHANTNFPLTGAHITTPCQSCHINGNYQLQYTDCYACHQSDYQVPTNPNHVTLQLSHRCETCHTTSAWLPSTFNHDTQFFRIYSGRHNGRWTSCSQCHPSIGNYTDFTCISCHEHNRTDMDLEHQGVSGYVYASPACYNCHRGV